MKIGAFFLAPVPAAIIGALVSWASGGFPRPVSVAIFYLLLLYGTQIIFGLAICAYLLRTNRRSVMQFGIGGLLMTSIPAALYLAWATAKHSAPAANALFVFALWSALGALTGLCYWFLAQRHGGKT
jgi:heme A synthase